MYICTDLYVTELFIATHFLRIFRVFILFHNFIPFPYLMIIEANFFTFKTYLHKRSFSLNYNIYVGYLNKNARDE